MWVSVTPVQCNRTENRLFNISILAVLFFPANFSDTSPLLTSWCVTGTVETSPVPGAFPGSQRFLPIHLETATFWNTALSSYRSAVGLFALLPIPSFLTSHLLVLMAGWHWQHMLPRADKQINLLGRWLRFCLLHHRLWELQSDPSPAPAHPQDPPKCQHPPAPDGEQRRPPASQAGVLQRRAPAGQWTGRYLLWSLSPRELWGSAWSLPAALPGGQQDDWELQWREAKRPPPCATQVTKYAGLEETSETGSDFQREICHYALMQQTGIGFYSPEK